MWHTFEMRWFFAEPPLDIAQHFDASAAAPHRTDWYAVPCDPRCGIKLREGRLETKLRVGTHGVRTFREISGHLESWQKWALAFGPGDCPAEQTLAKSGWLAVQKRRFLRHFEVTPGRVIETEQRPTNGCEFELTELKVQQQRWWTVAFEAVGPVDHLPTNLGRVVEIIHQNGGRRLPFVPECSFGYAHWLGLFVAARCHQ